MDVDSDTPTWAPSSILLSSGNASAPINIVSAFRCDPLDACAAIEDNVKMIKLPTDVYPPQWKDRKLVEDAIINAAREQGSTQLIRGRVNSAHKITGQRTVHLICKFGRRYYAKSPSNSVSSPTSDEIYHGFNATDEGKAIYKDDIRKDPMVNKQSGKRGVAKHEGKSMARRTKTSKPPLELRCKFNIRLILKPNEYWFIPHMSTKCGEHNHLRYSRGEMERNSNTLSAELKSKVALYSRFANGGSAQNIVTHESGGYCLLSQQQLDYVRESEESSPSSSSDDSRMNNTSVSSATKLINYLKDQAAKGKMRHIALHHEVQESTLVAISRAQKKRELEAAQEKKELQANNAEVTLAHDKFKQQLQSIDITLETHATLPTGALCRKEFPLAGSTDKMALACTLAPLISRLTVGQKVLLACAWCREDERLQFEKFPEVLMFDVTFGTNNEGRPLGISAGTDGNMETFTPVRVFQPSQCRWVFSWIFGTAIPELLGRESISHTQLLLTDGDSKIYNAFEEHQAELHPQARHALCMHHLVTKGIERLRPNLRDKDNLKVKNQITTFKHWLFSWMRMGSVETDGEFQISHRQLRTWLSSAAC